MDQMLEIANEEHIRIIFPLIDQHDFWAEFRRLPRGAA